METPTVNSLLVADRVYRDIETKKWVISGVFNTIHFPAFPAIYEQAECFFQITNVPKKADLRFRIEHADTGRLLVDIGGPIGSSSPLDVVEKKIVLRGIKFPAPGKYWVQLVSDEQILNQAPLHVKVLQEPPAPGTPGTPGIHGAPSGADPQPDLG